MVLVGDEAVLQDPKQQSRGRSLTFHVGDDRVLVDGREQGRTETIFQNEPRRP
jgi:lipopolysaccharide export system protein LptA